MFMNDSSRPGLPPFGHPGFEPSLSMSDDSAGPAVDSQSVRGLGEPPTLLWLQDEINRSGGTDVGGALAHLHEQLRQSRAGREPLLLIVTDGPPDPEAVEAAQERLRAARLPTPDDEVPPVPQN
jgi:hypothetical protein